MGFKTTIAGIALETVRNTSGSAFSNWIAFGPARVKNIVAQALWSTSSTNGTRLKVQASMTNLSTRGAFDLVRLNSSAPAQKLSTGTGANMVRYIRLTSTAGIINAAKPVRLILAAQTT